MASILFFDSIKVSKAGKGIWLEGNFLILLYERFNSISLGNWEGSIFSGNSLIKLWVIDNLTRFGRTSLSGNTIILLKSKIRVVNEEEKSVRILGTEVNKFLERFIVSGSKSNDSMSNCSKLFISFEDKSKFLIFLFCSEMLNLIFLTGDELKLDFTDE